MGKKVLVVLMVFSVVMGGATVSQSMGGEPTKTKDVKGPKTKSTDSSHKLTQYSRFDSKTKTAESKTTLEKVKNAEYYFRTFEERIRLINGKYENWQSRTTAKIYKDKIAFGDLNEDGKEDSAVIVTINGGGSGDFRELAILENQKGNLVYLTSEELGDRVIINSVIIEAGKIIVDMVTHAPDDALCCPSIRKVIKYKLHKNQLKVSEEKVLEQKSYKE